MAALKAILLLFIIKRTACQNLDEIFANVNQELGNFTAIAAELAWENSIHPNDPDLPSKSEKYQRIRIKWQDLTCKKLAALLGTLNSSQERQTYLLCRGPRFTFDETRLTSNLYDVLQSIYSDAEICIPSTLHSTHNLKQVEDAILTFLVNVKKFLGLERENDVVFAAKVAVNSFVDDVETLCLKGEADLDRIMAFSRNEEVLRWAWLAWREKVGLPMKKPYRELVKIENTAARRNGYANLGAAWRNELEIPRLRVICRQLFNEIKPLYTLLHGVVRFFLRQQYGDIVPKDGVIPAHLLGNLWAQNWEPLADLMITENIDLDASIKRLNWTVMHMVKRAEDYYQSMGLPAMTDKFWQESVFTRENNTDIRCHGTAADMFQDDDFRLLYCADTTMEDFYVLHHELGHIQYYMAYQHQPAIFRQAHSALHETIGDTIMYGVLSPQHLNRLGLINDSLLYTQKNIEESTMKMELAVNEFEEPTLHPSILNVKFAEDDAFLTDTVIEPALDNIIEPKLKETNESWKSIEELLKTVMKVDSFNKRHQHTYDLIQKLKAGTTKNFNDENKLEHVAHENTNTGATTTKLSNPIELFEEDVSTDMILLLKQALNKIPQIPFALVMDEYRWKFFDGILLAENQEFWDLVEELQGVGPPSERGEQYFDAGAKFHVPDNTPYIRYFLSSFLQHQLFETLCKAAVYGRQNVDDSLPSSFSFHRCDIYGSKAAGKVLKDFMSRGHSQHWSGILHATTGEHIISAAALNRYYQPLYELLDKFVRAHRIPTGW